MVRKLRLARLEHCKLSENEPHQFSARYAISHYKSDSVYTFIPKNSCTTMRYSLALENGCIQGAEDFEWVHHNNRTFMASLRELVLAKYTFVILRDPAFRIASAFLDKMIVPDEHATKSHINRFIAAAQMSEEAFDAFTFREFCQALRSSDILRIDPHWRPQSDFLIYEEYDRYFAFEQFAQAIPEIEAKTGMVIQDARKISKHGTDQYRTISDRGFADTSIGELKEMKASLVAPAHDTLFDATLLAEINEIFEEDYRLMSQYL